MATYDAIVVGTGQAGPALTRRLAGSGMKVAIIEQGRFGGTCVNTGCTVLVGKLAMENVSRASEKGETEGFMKMFIDADSKEILGASFLGTAGDGVIHCVLDVMYAKAPYTIIECAMHMHPTAAEFIPSLLQDLAPLPAEPGSDSGR